MARRRGRNAAAAALGAAMAAALASRSAGAGGDSATPHGRPVHAHAAAYERGEANATSARSLLGITRATVDEDCWPRGVPAGERCAYVTAKSACGPRSGRLPYTRAWFCRPPGPATAIAAAAGALAWGGGLALLLAVVAGRFLVPAVAYACAVLRVPPALAGVTLLAFAGGAPDLFTEVAAVLASRGDDAAPDAGRPGGPPTTADDVGLAVATALGSGLATLCGGLAVVGLAAPRAHPGAPAILPPAFPDRGAFFRDVAAYATAAVTLAACLWNGRFAAGEAAGLLALYAAYISASVWGARRAADMDSGGQGGAGGGGADPPTVVVHPGGASGGHLPPAAGSMELAVFARGGGGGKEALSPPAAAADGGGADDGVVLSSPRSSRTGGAPVPPPAPGLVERRASGAAAALAPPSTPPPAAPATPGSPLRPGAVAPPPSARRTGSGFWSGLTGRPPAASPAELGPLLAAADWDGPPTAVKARGRSSAGGGGGEGFEAAGASGSLCPPPRPRAVVAAAVAAARAHWPAPPHWHPALRAVAGGLAAPVLVCLHATTPCLAHGSSHAAGGDGGGGDAPPEHSAHGSGPPHPPGPTYSLWYALSLAALAPPAGLAFMGAAPWGRHAAWWGPAAFFGAWGAASAVLAAGLLPPLARRGWAAAPRATPAMALLAMVASSAWLSASADEVVELVRALGRAAGWRAEALGGALLSWGEALPELAAAASLSASGAPGMALSSCFGGPIFDVCVGLAVPALAAAGRAKEALGAPLTRGLALLVCATLAVLAGLALAIPSRRCGWRVGRGVGLAVAGAYVASQAAFAAVEGFG